MDFIYSAYTYYMSINYNECIPLDAPNTREHQFILVYIYI